MKFEHIEQRVQSDATGSMNSDSTSFLEELRKLGFLALPIVVAQVSYMALSVVDMLISGHCGVVDQAGVGLGYSAFSPIVLLAVGTLMAVSPSVAQLHGAEENRGDRSTSPASPSGSHSYLR